MIEIIFTTVTHVTLTFDLVNPKSIGVLSLPDRSACEI